MPTTGLLVVSNIKHIGRILRCVEKYVRDLYIHLDIPIGLRQPLPAWSRVISQLYKDSIIAASSINLRVLVGTLRQSDIAQSSAHLKNVALLFSDSNASSTVCEELRSRLKITSNVIYLNGNETETPVYHCDQIRDLDKNNRIYETVVLGGTFDRLHVGHKIFLTEAVLRAYKRLVVGVTAPNMLKNKILSELVLSVDQRMKDVREFLMEIDPTLQYDMVAIEDAFGPTKSDPDLNMIVVSAETMTGSHKINQLRAENRLPPLAVVCIDLVLDNIVDEPKEPKISSSNTRIDLLGTRIKPREPRPNLPIKPYIIGLTGGIASGKSTMAQLLKKKGAIVLDCDPIAHELYEPQKICYMKIVKQFGNDILGSNGVIDRSKLGLIVFENTQQMQILNAIVWPELIKEVKARISRLSLSNAINVVVVEAAVLLLAKWETECHEVWSMIIPPDEAVRRVMKRNQLSEKCARQRLSSQMDNKDIVNRSHIVFSSLWTPEFTAKQIEKAWTTLMAELQMDAK